MEDLSVLSREYVETDKVYQEKIQVSPNRGRSQRLSLFSFSISVQNTRVFDGRDRTEIVSFVVSLSPTWNDSSTIDPTTKSEQ